MSTKLTPHGFLATALLFPGAMGYSCAHVFPLAPAPATSCGPAGAWSARQEQENPEKPVSQTQQTVEDRVKDPAAEAESSDIDELHARTLRLTRRLAASIDAFLSDERSLAESNTSWLTLRTDGIVEEGSDPELKFRFGARLVLPRTEEKLHLTFGGDLDNASEDLALADDAAAPSAEDELALSLQAFLEQLRRRNLRFDLGLSLRDQTLDPYAGIRWRGSSSIGPVLLRGTERFRWFADRGAESRSRLDAERSLGSKFLLRGTGRADWSEADEGWSFNAALRLFHSAGSSRLLVYEAVSEWITDPAHVLDVISVRARYSSHVFRDWIRFELAPQLSWPRERDRDLTLGMVGRLELLVGRKP